MEGSQAPAFGGTPAAPAGGAFARALSSRRIRAGTQRDGTRTKVRREGIALYEWLAMLSPIVNILVSANLLYLMGVSYASEGGNPLMKLHPGTYLSIIAFGLFLMRDGRPIQEFQACIRRSPVAVWYLSMIAMCCLVSVLTRGFYGTAVYIETYVPAGLMLLIFETSSNDTKRLMGRIIFGLFVMNVCIATVENLVQKPLVPIYILDQLITPAAGEYRGAALYDHPLSGATFTMVAAIMLMGMDLRRSVKGLLLGFFAIGLLGFGGRTAMGVTIATFAIWGVVYLVRGSVNGTVTRYEVGAVLFAAVALPVLLAIVVSQTTIGERIMARLYWDDSAETRIVQFRVLADLTPKEWMLGASIDRVRDIIFQIGLRMPFNDIENFWLVMFINLGAVGFIFYLFGFLPLLWDLWRRSPNVPKVMLLTTILVASTSNSLGRKCNILTVLVPAMIATSAFQRRHPVSLPADSRMHAPVSRSRPILRPRAEPGAFAGRLRAVRQLNHRTESSGPSPASGA